MSESPLNAALRNFEATEANLVKAERVVAAIGAAIPAGVVFGDNPEHENNCRIFETLLAALPKIDGWKPTIRLMDLNEIAQRRMDALEGGEFEFQVSVELQIDEPPKLLREYRHRFNMKRRDLVRDALQSLAVAVDNNLHLLIGSLKGEVTPPGEVDSPLLDNIKSNVGEISMLLGSSIAKPAGWSDLIRHLRFSMLHDLNDIIERDWPSVKAGLAKALCGENDPVPVDIDDLGVLVSAKPLGPVATKLRWERLTEEDFERLIFSLISSEIVYENPEWLMQTNAPDRGRDLSVWRVVTDPLSGTQRLRVIIQCKHWQSKSVRPTDIATLREQLKLWEPPKLDVCVIATSGRFTQDAVSVIERHNHSDRALKIEMWAESHLELLLANRPALIAEFNLR